MKRLLVLTTLIFLVATLTASAKLILDNDQGHVLTGTPEADSIYGNGGDDSIDARDGRDDVAAGPGDDRVEGGDKPDTINGNPGHDVLLGEGGDDRITSNTDWPTSDVIDCGGGTDEWRADSADAVYNCEIHIGG